MPVGDVGSFAKGSAARYNDGKPELAQLPMEYWWDAWDWYTEDRVEEPLWVGDVLTHWVVYQNEGDPRRLQMAAQFLPLDVWADACQVLAYGAHKYAQWNWTKGQPWSVPFNSALRHLKSYMQGNKCDEESGLPHLWHFACNVIFLDYFTRHYPEGEDWVVFPEQEPEGEYDQGCTKDVHDYVRGFE